MILVTGATGFVGSHLVRGLKKAGHELRALVRSTAELDRLARDPGIAAAVGSVGNLDSLIRAAEGCKAVIHLVGIIQPGPGYTFESIHVEGTANVIEAAKRAGTVRHFIYQSALGTRKDAVSRYHKTKYQAEQLTKKSGLDFSITRPSIIFGKGDGFTARLTDVIRGLPVVPIIGPGKGRLQPIYIDNLVEVFVKIVLNPAYFGRTLELGGPEQLTFDEVVEQLKDALGSKKPTMHVPIFMVKPAATLMEMVLPHPPVTNDQLTMLQEDNICSMKDMEELGVKPISFRDGLKNFLRG